jgi:hypothetical protein
MVAWKLRPRIKRFLGNLQLLDQTIQLDMKDLFISIIDPDRIIKNWMMIDLAKMDPKLVLLTSKAIEHWFLRMSEVKKIAFRIFTTQSNKLSR